MKETKQELEHDNRRLEHINLQLEHKISDLKEQLAELNENTVVESMNDMKNQLIEIEKNYISKEKFNEFKKNSVPIEQYDEMVEYFKKNCDFIKSINLLTNTSYKKINEINTLLEIGYAFNEEEILEKISFLKMINFTIIELLKNSEKLITEIENHNL